MLILVRGIPGSGKSTYARNNTSVSGFHLEADNYFIRPDGATDALPSWPDLVVSVHTDSADALLRSIGTAEPASLASIIDVTCLALQQ